MIPTKLDGTCGGGEQIDRDGISPTATTASTLVSLVALDWTMSLVCRIDILIRVIAWCEQS